MRVRIAPRLDGVERTMIRRIFDSAPPGAINLGLGQPDLPNDPRFANMVERVRNRALTDKTVGDIFAELTRDELLQRLSDADIAFAEVNTMADLARHAHLRRITVDTPQGPVTYPAPGAITVDKARQYGAVPAIGQRINVKTSDRTAS